MDPTIEKIIFVFLGWLLGFLSPIIHDTIKRWINLSELKSVLKIELGELQYRFALARYVVEQKFFGFDRSLLIWLKLIVDDYDGVNKSESVENAINRMLNDKAFSAMPPSKKEEYGASSLKKYSPAVLQTQISNFFWFDKKIQSRLIEIIFNIEILNQIVDDSRYFYQLTFQVSGHNHDIAISNLIDSYKNYSERLKIIVDHISELKDLLSKNS